MKLALDRRALLAISVLVAGVPSHAYQVICQNTPQTVTSISSVFAESRQDSGFSKPNRFHAGIDITNTQCKTVGNSIMAIEGGRIATTTPGCEAGAACFRITTLDGSHAFDYVHVEILGSLSNGSTVQAGQQVGTVEDPAPLAPHLHLNEIQRVGTVNFRINPQRPGGLNFQEPTDRPTYDSITVGSVSDSVILVPEYTGSGPDGDQTYTPYEYRNNTFYVRGAVEALISANDGTVQRKGLWGVGLFPQTAGYLYSGQINISMDTLADQASDLSDVRTIFLQRNTLSNTFFGMNRKLNGYPNQETIDGAWHTDAELPGAVTACAKITDYPQGNTVQRCKNVVIDRSATTFTMTNAGGTVADGGATSTTTVTINATDPGGIYSIGLSGPSHSSTTYIAGVQTSTSISFPIGGGTLSDGSYTASIADLAGNTASADFIVSAGPIDAPEQNDPQPPGGGPGPNEPGGTPKTTTSTPQGYCTDSIAGIRRIVYENPGGSQNFEFPDCPSDAYAGPVTLEVGENAFTCVSCSGANRKSTFPVTAGTFRVGVCITNAVAGTACGYSVASKEQIFNATSTVVVTSNNGQCNGSTQAIECAKITSPYSDGCSCQSSDAQYTGQTGSAANQSFTIINATNAALGTTLRTQLNVQAPGYGPAGTNTALAVTLNPGESASVRFDISQVGNSNNCDSAPLRTSFRCKSGNTGPGPCEPSLLDRLIHALRSIVLGPVGGPICLTGSGFVYASTTTVNISTPLPSGINIDTTTISLYSFDGTSWVKFAASSQSISVSSINVVSATGTVIQYGAYGVFFTGIDTTTPVSQFSIQGSSYVFDQTLFISTDAYVVLSATDPVVNGFASQVATTVYRIDAASSTDPYSVYSSSIPLPLGTHVFQYYSYDWAGNTETVKTATFTVTAGAGFRNTGDHRVVGSLLAGYLGSDAKTEIVSAAENNYTLLVTSVNRATMMSASNIGSVGVGPQTPEGRLDVGQGNVAVGLRSGNATSTGTTLQITFGYNGDYAMRHALRTRHSTATDGNRMDFMLWSPAAGATTTVANVNVLSLQGISTANDGAFHVMPFGEPDAEVEVSNGSSLGGGTIQRQQVLTPSSRRFKSDIRYLDARQEDAALDEIAGMRHARFRYKSRDGRPQPLNVGLIYEEAPESIRAAEKTLSSVERVAEVEMALKAALRQLEALEKRYAELKARRKNP